MTAFDSRTDDAVVALSKLRVEIINAAGMRKAVRRYLDDPTDENRGMIERSLALYDDEQEPGVIDPGEVRVGDVLEISYYSVQFGHNEKARRTVVSVGDRIMLRDEESGSEYPWRHPDRDRIYRLSSVDD